MPSVGFPLKYWRLRHVCLQNKKFVVILSATAYNELEVGIELLPDDHSMKPITTVCCHFYPWSQFQKTKIIDMFHPKR